MHWIKFLVGSTFLIFLIYAGNTHGLVNAQVPAVAKLMDPFAGIWQQAQTKNAQAEPISINADVEGEVVIDQKGVPHIFANSVADAMYLQGYLHARDRLFQMDISVRSTEGRLAEILGPNLLERDKLQRRKGMRVAAQRTLDRWKKNQETSDVIKAYCQGVNAYLAQLDPADYPVEYKLLGFAPETWTPFKSALFAKKMAESLCFRHRDLATTHTRALLGDSLFAHLYPEYNPEDSPVIPENTIWPFGPIPSQQKDGRLTEKLPFPELEMPPEGIGSNNWALAGAKTATGAPLLSNDPHLALTLPSIWYEVQLHTPQMNIYGVSLPTLPGILIGFNETSAWGITNVGHDVVDWYKVNWVDSTYQKYLLDGKAVSPDWVADTIWVRNQSEPLIIQTPWTVFGPLVYDQPTDGHYNLAMRWLAHDAPFMLDTDNMEVFLRLATNNGLSDYEDALRGFDSPASNIVYANQQNDIALTVMGHLPLRADQQGRFVQDGSKRENQWTGYIPFAEIPRMANPERQFVASANQRSADKTYPHYYLGGFEDYRGRYINRRLEEMKQASPEDMMALQHDSYSLKAEETVPLLLAGLEGLELNADQQKLQELLTNWDLRYTAQQQAPVLFNSWYDSLYQLTFDEILSQSSDTYSLVFPEDWRFIQLLEAVAEDPIFDRQATGDQVETRQELIRLAFAQASAALIPKLKEGLNWDTHRATRIRHLARIPGFDSGPIHTDGARNTPNALSSTFGPSWRMVVSLEQPIRAWGVLPGGSSGNIGSPFYSKGIAEWSEGDYFELQLYPSAQAARADALEVLEFR